jgi:CheY-like chemotaxis protein
MPVDMDPLVLNHLKSLTLLCVEDSKATQQIYNSIFKKLIKKIIFSDNGKDGYDNFITNDIDIIISDQEMPILNGLDMIEKIRNVNKTIPIILVTGTEETDVIVKALHLNVNNFLKKPIQIKELINALENTSKILIANNHLEEVKKSRKKRIKALTQKNDYSTYQEELAFSKELNIIRNDFYYHRIDNSHTILLDFFYRPLDLVSGDAYSARRINEHLTFYFIVDGMGKGLSASLSAMLMTSYVNHLIDMMNKTNNFDLHTLIESSLQYIETILLNEEVLAVDFITIDHNECKMEYAKFSMPSILMQTTENEIITLKSNNQPINKYINDFKISVYDISNIIKFLMYSDGLVENSTTAENKQYINYIQNDFLNSFSKEDMVNKFLEKINIQEDDITFIFINKLNLYNNILQVKTFQSSLDAVDEANEWYEDIWSNLTDDVKKGYSAGIVFTEMFMNAFEHGNLAIDTITKDKLLSEDIYFTTLEKMQNDCNKKITVTINKIKYNSDNYITTQIEDEGSGFDTKLLTDIFKNSDSFNGRGVYISKNSSMGIYYNRVGNFILFLHKL